MNTAARIALGTAQFGLDYGVTNRAGQLSEQTVRAVLARAREAGVQWLDTAAAYGAAEVVLGRLASPASGFRVCTKVVSAADAADPVGGAQRQFGQSLARCGRSRVDVLMVHDARQLLGADGAALYRWLAAQKDAGRAAAIGASVYEGSEAVALTDRYALDWIQLPLSLLDQRALADGTLARLKSRGVSVQARSVLLQGLLLADPTRLPAAFAPAQAPLARVRAAAAACGMSVLDLALGFVASVAEVDQIVLGVESPAQLDECVRALGTPAKADWRDLACDELAVLDPRRWPAGVRIVDVEAGR
ncbi:MAG: bifunctional regulator KidO [Burkholderiaceae bacterium]